MSRRQRRREERAGGSDDDDAGEQEAEDLTAEDGGAPDGAPRRRRARLRSRSSERTSADSAASGASGRSMHSSASCRAARQMPDHVPPLSARLAASARALLFSRSDGYFLSRYQVAASTTLQMLLYFNAVYAMVFFVLFQSLFAWKATIWPPPLVIELITSMAFWVWVVIEVTRLGLGYFGNLAERVPWLMGFWILTLFPQPVILLYFIVLQGLAEWFVLPIEVMLCLAFECIYVAQLVVAYRANKRLVAKAAADFHLQPVDADGAL